MPRYGPDPGPVVLSVFTGPLDAMNHRTKGFPEFLLQRASK